MRKFKIEIPDGRRVTVEGDDEPSDEEVEEIIRSLTDGPSDDFQPSVTRRMMSVLNKISARLEDTPRDELAQTLKAIANRLEQPVAQLPALASELTIPAPIVNVRHEAPKRWDIEITGRDEFGRIKTFTMEAEK